MSLKFLQGKNTNSVSFNRRRYLFILVDSNLHYYHVFMFICSKKGFRTDILRFMDQKHLLVSIGLDSHLSIDAISSLGTELSEF